jgi:prepilin-type N-terminal cleavage/methylation domain-containing protein
MSLQPESGSPLGRAGFSLIELLVAMVVMTAILGALGSALVVNQREWLSGRFWRRADEAARSALIVTETALRGAGANPMSATLTAIDPNPLAHATWDNVRVQADFGPADGDVNDLYENVQLWTANDTLYARWSTSGAAEAVAVPVRALTFAYFRSDGTQVTTAGTIGEATRVRVTVTAPGNGTGARLLRRSGWVYLRNRT